ALDNTKKQNIFFGATCHKNSRFSIETGCFLNFLKQILLAIFEIGEYLGKSDSKRGKAPQSSSHFLLDTGGRCSRSTTATALWK
ncbi:MAG: hypothetical protein Q4A48_07345, partial [Bacillota bacterium]|nr:hypothetical protein [Bacillota bacterium]